MKHRIMATAFIFMFAVAFLIMSTVFKDNASAGFNPGSGETTIVGGLQKTAFGELLSAELTPIFQNDFSYNINPKIWHTHANNGTTTVDTNRLKLSTGAVANQSSQVLSRIPVKYNAGQGGLVRFTGAFTTCTANSTQLIGVGDPGDGFFFGCNGASFGTLRRVGGVTEVRTLTVTTKSTTAENITITLDGDADATVAVTDATATDVTTTANDIASHDYSNLGRGWEAHSEGDTVVFISYDASVRTGTYSLSGATTAVGTVAQTLAGVAQTDTWTAQTAWSDDKMDGSGDSGMTIDITKGNVFQIRYQWLGYGQITFWVEDSATGDFALVNSVDFANSSLTPLIYNPSLPMTAIVENTTNTSDIVLYSSSMAGFTEGKSNGGHVHHGVDGQLTGITTTQVPILTIHNKDTYQGKLNRTRIKLTATSMGVDHTKPMIIRYVSGATLTGASFVDVDTNDSVIEYDTSATAVSGGDLQFSVPLSGTGSDVIPMTPLSFYLNPGETMTVTAEAISGTGADASTSFNWEELF